MGRGRAKAKQTKVARKLKYQTLDTDLSALQRELSGDVDDDAPEDVEADPADVEDYLDDEDDYSRR